MIYSGTSVQLSVDADGIAELRFERKNGPVNKLDRFTLHELQDAVEELQQQPDIRGLLVTSGKPAFIVGADITEFSENFALDNSAFKAWLRQTHKLFGAIENLPYPTVAAINGMALGGGFEVALCCDYRILASDGGVGLPEVNLGIYPGWGGTVRLSRLIGLPQGVDWLLSGRVQKSSSAQAARAVDRVVAAAELHQEACSLLQEQINDGHAYLAARARKWTPIPMDQDAQEQLFQFSKKISRLEARHYPAPTTILALVRSHAPLAFDQAIEAEVEALPALAKGPVARSLIGLFLNDQLLKRKAKQAVANARPVSQAAVLGAGIMGGGIAYQSASSGTPILMKDINGEALELGLREADGLLSKQVAKGHLTAAKKEAIFNGIEATLDYAGFTAVDLVVEAVVENPRIKAAVLSELEQNVAAGTVLTSNTSSISITRLAEALQAPENFCGMHFFNPVHAMPLVEVIRGAQSSAQAIATTVAYAASLGKTPIVVNDCPGFLVNRILFPYFNAFNRLLKDGVDFQRVDRVMEAFGWPMGPAYLADVCGLDTLVNADAVMVEGFPERMAHDGKAVMEAMVEGERLGQKNGRGFYHYGTDTNGRRTREAEDSVYDLVESMATAMPEISDHEIGERMMIPLCLEAVRCLEEGVADSAAEVDMGPVLGLGFPRFRGGPLRYIDNLGLPVFAALVQKHHRQGPLYQLTPGLKQRLAQKDTFYHY
ncbi:MAG: fatty acid oxidation complex subunit alpha FadB [Motiliproteus sp.]